MQAPLSATRPGDRPERLAPSRSTTGPREFSRRIDCAEVPGRPRFDPPVLGRGRGGAGADPPRERTEAR
jgi:hypothetical protein